MGMSDYVIECEEKFFDSCEVFVKESEHVTEAMSKAVALGKTEVPFMDVEDIEEGIAEMWNEYWAQYA
jgi:hypothetical protein